MAYDDWKGYPVDKELGERGRQLRVYTNGERLTVHVAHPFGGGEIKLERKEGTNLTEEDFVRAARAVEAMAKSDQAELFAKDEVRKKIIEVLNEQDANNIEITIES